MATFASPRVQPEGLAMVLEGRGTKVLVKASNAFMNILKLEIKLHTDKIHLALVTCLCVLHIS